MCPLWVHVTSGVNVYSFPSLTSSMCYHHIITDQPGATIDEEIYDDVDSQSLPPPPPLSRYSNINVKTKQFDSNSQPSRVMISSVFKAIDYNGLLFCILFLLFCAPAFQPWKEKARLTRWTQRSRRGLRKRRRNSGKSLKSDPPLFL